MMQGLYPDIKPYDDFMLPVSSLHKLYVEQCGNPQGIPVLILHGGPGAGCNTNHRRFFDPQRFRMILFDQRGAGRSTPYAELEDNNLSALLSDIDVVLNRLQVPLCILAGGSWGSTLALAFAQSQPQRIMALLLRGVFLGTDDELRWFYQGGAGHVFADHWQDFVAPLTVPERDDVIAAYYQRLIGGNELLSLSAAKQWCVWEAKAATLRPNPDMLEYCLQPHIAQPLAKLETHYFVNNCFLQPGQLIRNMPALVDIPGTIIHGRYDMVCPLSSALSLHQAWPASQLHIIRDAGHAASEAGIVDAIVRAGRDLAKTFAKEFPTAG